MGLDVKQLTEDMLAKMKPLLGERWAEVQRYGKAEFEKLGKTLVTIEAQKLTGKISEQQAVILFDMQKNAVKAVIAAVQGIGEDAAARALNVALGELADRINQALGFKLI